jgi:hypothetical protein
MPTLFLSAPKGMTPVGGGAYYRDFYTILNNKIGPDYAIYRTIRAQLHAGIRVVVFDRDRQLKAEGVISALTPQPSQRIQRYHVHIPNLTVVPYTNPPRVNRCGVAFV